MVLKVGPKTLGVVFASVSVLLAGCAQTTYQRGTRVDPYYYVPPVFVQYFDPPQRVTAATKHTRKVRQIRKARQAIAQRKQAREQGKRVASGTVISSANVPLSVTMPTPAVTPALKPADIAAPHIINSPTPSAAVAPATTPATNAAEALVPKAAEIPAARPPVAPLPRAPLAPPPKAASAPVALPKPAPVPRNAEPAANRAANLAAMTAPAAAPNDAGAGGAAGTSGRAQLDEARVLLRKGEVLNARARINGALSAPLAEVLTEMARTYDADVHAKLPSADAPPDAAKARQFYEQAARLGSPEAKAAMERIRAEGFKPN